MKQRKQPLPGAYWKHIGAIVFLFVLIFAQIGLTVLLTDGREIHDFTRTDWMIFAAFVLMILWTLAAAFYIGRNAGKLLIAHRRQEFLSFLHDGLDPAAYVCILPEFVGDRRALITRTDGGYQLMIDQYDDVSGAWQTDGEPPIAFTDRAALLQYLENDCDIVIDPEDLDRFLPETKE